MSKLFLAEASAIGDALAASAIWHADQCNWLRRQLLNLGPLDPSAPPTLTALGPTVYTGTAGVATFLARLHRATGSDVHARAARGAARHALAHADLVDDSVEGQVAGSWRFSYYMGKLGVAVATHEVGQALDDATLRRGAARIVRELAPTLPAPFETDVVMGAASGVPALLRLAQDGVPGARALAVALGDAIVAESRVGADGARSWGSKIAAASKYEDHLLGFSHGAAGIGWSLSTLHAATGDERFRKAALDAFAYERRWYDAAKANWPDLRSGPRAEGHRAFIARWCHGAPGGGMARALAHATLGSDTLRDEARASWPTMERALEDVLSRPGEDFTPCCGVLGIAESAWIARAALGGDGHAIAARVAQYGIDRFGAEARARWPDVVEWPTGVRAGAYPTLMQGVAGIGHFLLRAHDPSVPPLAIPPTPAGR